VDRPLGIKNLSVIASNYDALLCDAWGVIHDGVALFDGVEEALRKFRAECGPVIILTNAPRPASIIPPQLDRLGLSRDAYDAVVTSGDATRAEIIKRLPAPAFRLGPEKDEALYDGVEVSFAELANAEFIVCTGLIDDQSENPESYRPLLQRAADRNLPMICANPDIVVRWGGRLIYCAGALAEIYQELGGDVIFGGKPHAPIYDLSFAAIENARGGPVDRRRILAIGDGVKTDIAGANNQNIDAVLVSGEGGIHTGGGSIEDVLHGAGVRVIAAMEQLRW